MRFVKKGWSLLLVISLAWLTAACGMSGGDRSEMDTVRVVEVTHSIFYAPQYVAIHKGFFKEEGIDLRLSNGFGGDKTMTALLSGEADIVLVGAETGVYVTARGAQNPVIGFAQLTQKDGSFLVSRKPVNDFEWKDLKGKELLGQRKGGMPQMVSEHVQRKNGLTPHKDVKIIQNIDFKNLGSAFASGTGDYVQLFEPVASKLEQEGKGHIVASFGEDSGNLPYTVYLTKDHYLKENPELAERFTRALYKAQRWVANHSSEEIADAIQPSFQDTDQEILVTVIDRYKSQNTWASDPIIDREEYNLMIQVMDEAGELPGQVPYKKVIRTDISEKVMKGSQ
ncbi:NitT/TauT family transport system substrate-binding protein [Melghirimyces profundicolus]|uniref:NitT/TauT family transport system substrate-binding protein n=1 Tax=Melghirimyces profundicolus TaxID=1242148 RepID=A0A2T6BTJ9_9BACL|nr:ABC transporter substrate-binding protein [Melghirimyces profundicolus]PTX59369.1 NitT/TauT family transport system substrate-binding protein [Melghirimyces profundicolus]